MKDVALLTAALLLTGGCGNKEAPTPRPAKSRTSAAAIRSVERVTATATGQTQVVAESTFRGASNGLARPGDTVAKAATVIDKTQTGAATQSSATVVTNVPAALKGRTLIDQAKACVAEGKWAEALALLNQLPKAQLTVDETSVVEELKQQIQAGSAALSKSKVVEGVTNVLAGSIQSGQPPTPTNLIPGKQP